ncbi:MAG: hypothetical protein V7K92_19865 [Nostoc sp.]|uniref:hypothetical protein n=1 Tax=Nostoc sp. TaxID=1180 RepID=UPI002FF01028
MSREEAGEEELLIINPCPIQLLERLRPKRSYAAGFTAPFGLPRLLYQTLRVACFPVGVRSAQVAQGKPPNS